MRVMVTGASGLLGEEIADHFEAKGHEVIRLKGRKRIRIRGFDIVFLQSKRRFLKIITESFKNTQIWFKS